MLKKSLILILVIIINVIPAISFYENELDALEQSKYGQTFQSDSLSDRLNRLENDLLGMSQTGDLDSRIVRLTQVVQPNINPNNIVYPQSNYNSYEMQPKRNLWQRFWDNVSDTFDSTGVITGYTPGLYSSGYGYAPNIYRNELRNMFYNSQNYCPYHNTFHNNFPNRFYNRFNGSFPPINNRILYNQRFNPYYQNAFNNNYYNRYGNYNRIYSPPNIVTRSAVHIMND